MKTVLLVLLIAGVLVALALVLRAHRRTSGRTPSSAPGARAVDAWQESLSLKSEREWQPAQRHRDPALDRLMTEEQLQKPRKLRN